MTIIIITTAAAAATTTDIIKTNSPISQNSEIFINITTHREVKELVRQFCRSSEPSRQSSSPSHVHDTGMQRSSVGPQRNCDVAEQFATQVLASSDRKKKSGQAHEDLLSPGASKQRCEHPPLFVPHGFATTTVHVILTLFGAVRIIVPPFDDQRQYFSVNFYDKKLIDYNNSLSSYLFLLLIYYIILL